MKYSKVERRPFAGAARIATEEAEALRERIYGLARLMDSIPVQPVDDIAVEPVTERRILTILKARRYRARLFDAELFADPAWDMLLELFAAQLGQRRMAVGSLCIGSGVPATTALRWIKTLEQRGLIVRRPDPVDGRRVYVELTELAGSAMEKLLGQFPPNEKLV